jgi:hypothetical protein
VAKRTTLTLEDDVLEGLQEEVRRTAKPFKAVVNEAIRAGLVSGAHRKVPAFRVVAADLRLREGVDLDDVEGLERVEGPRHP